MTLREGGEQDLVQLLQGYYAAALLLGLSRAGVLTELEKPKPVGALAKRSGVDRATLTLLLRFLERTTTFIERSGARYRLSDMRLAELSFQLEKFLGAYGASVAALGAAPVNDRAMMTGFRSASGIDVPVAEQLIVEAGAKHLLDLGCGLGTLLLGLALRDPEFCGIGVDQNAWMCREARRRVRAAGAHHRVRILRGDARDLRDTLASAEPDAIDSVHGRSFLNSFFGAGDRGVVSVLKRMRKLLPGRPAWFVDYYGELNRPLGDPSESPLALLQDVAQLVSGQGIPHPDARSWRRAYRKAGCRVLGMHDFRGGGIRWFIHEVVL